MGQAMRKLMYDEFEYLESEIQAPVKREFVAGAVYAMAGATAWHNRISLNVATRLDAATRGTPCEVFMADMKVKVEAHRSFYYPDVLLACEPDDDQPLYRTRPCLIVEVFSPSTAGIDEREKWHHYRDIPTLRHYLLVDSESRQVRLRTRAGSDWLDRPWPRVTAWPSPAARCGWRWGSPRFTTAVVWRRTRLWPEDPGFGREPAWRPWICLRHPAAYV